MKIFQLLPYYFPIHPGGLEKIAQTIAEWLQDISWYEVTTVVSDIGLQNSQVREDSATVIFLPSWDIVAWFPVPKFRQSVFRKKMRYVISQQPDCIVTHTRFFLSSMIWGILAKISWAKRIHIEHWSWFVRWYSWYVKLSAWLFDRTVGWWIFRQCDTIVTISHMHKKFISRFTKKEPVVIYNPIDFVPQKKTKNTLLHIGFVWRLVPLKWVDLLISALYHLQDKERRCTIVGDWPQRELLEGLVISLWMKDRIRFMWADDRANRLHTFDIFVNPSYQEWVPTTVIEALIAKCIVVATDVGGTREISDKEDLLLCISGDGENLNSMLRIAYTSLHYVGTSYTSVKTRFSAEHAIAQYREVINHV